MTTYGQAKLERKKGNYELSNNILLSYTFLNTDNKFKPSKTKRNLIGKNYLDLKKYEMALEYFKSVESSLLDIGDSELEKDLYNNIAICYKHLGDFNRAIQYYDLHAEKSKLYLETKVDQTIKLQN